MIPEMTVDNIRLMTYKVLGGRTASYILPFFRDVTPNEKVPTLGIDKYGRIVYNPKFIDKYVENEVEMVSLLTHEFFHPLMRHHGRSKGKNPMVSNMAQDSIINSTISGMPFSNKGSIFEKIYKDFLKTEDISPEMKAAYHILFNGWSKISEKYPHMREAGIRVWEDGDVGSETVYDLILEHFNENPPPKSKCCCNKKGDGDPQEGESQAGEAGQEEPQQQEEQENGEGQENGEEPFLIGDHSEKSQEEELSPEELLERAEAAQKMMKEQGKGCSVKGNQMMEIIVKDIISKYGYLKKDSLSKWSTRKRFGSFVKNRIIQERRTAPFMLNPSRRDVMKMALGARPVFFNNPIRRIKKEPDKEIILYVDVSGSIGASEVQEIFALLSKYKFLPEKIFEFSTEIVEITSDELKEGVIKTTGGTDFDIIYKHAKANDYKDIVIFSDGQGRVSAKPDNKMNIFEVGISDKSYRQKPFPFEAAGFATEYADIEDLTL